MLRDNLANLLSDIPPCIYQMYIEVGIEVGIEKRTFDIAKNMLADNFDINVIGNITGLSAEQISALKKRQYLNLQ
jgi:hypothetical protein